MPTAARPAISGRLSFFLLAFITAMTAADLAPGETKERFQTFLRRFPTPTHCPLCT
jgi:hypothetical protein